MLSDALLRILCCPDCRGDLRYDREQNTLTCSSCGRVYAIQDDIPIMLVDDRPPQPGPDERRP